MEKIGRRADGSPVMWQELAGLADPESMVLPRREDLMARLGMTDKAARLMLIRCVDAGLVGRMGRKYTAIGTPKPRQVVVMDPKFADWIPIKVCSRSDGSPVMAGEVAGLCLHGFPGYPAMAEALGLDARVAAGAMWAAGRCRAVMRRKGRVWLAATVRESLNRMMGLPVDYRPDGEVSEHSQTDEVSER